jgi:uncharacterized protein YndB with AHSA1/START domain
MTETQDAFGTLERGDDGVGRLRFERTFEHSREMVWRAVTEPQHLAHWFPTTIEGERRPGARLRFGFPDDRWPAFEGEMLVFEPPALMQLRWGADVVRIELADLGDERTALTLLVTLEELGKAARDGTGWHRCLDALGAHLGGDDAARGLLTDGWKPVNDAYVQRFGPEAATIGPPEGAQVS